MKTLLALTIMAPLLAACAGGEPPVIAAGPTFEQSRFVCGARPLPPDPAAAAKAASAAARYEDRIGTWGQRCQNKLASVGHELAAAGQLTAPAETARPQR